MTGWQVVGCVPLAVFLGAVLWAMIDSVGLLGCLAIWTATAVTVLGLLLVTGALP